MAELAPSSPAATAAATEEGGKTVVQAAWRSVVGWLGVILQLVVQVARSIVAPAPPSLARLLSLVGLRIPLTWTPDPSAAGFKPLPVEPPIDSPPPPKQQEETLARLTVVLDLDETLVCAYESSTLPSSVREQAIEAGLKCFELECISTEKDDDGRDRVNYVTVFERPGLHEFLQQISEFADLILFTAGLEGYARPLIDRIDSKNIFSLRLYRPATVNTKYQEHVKDLSCISKDFRRIVIVDNNPFSFLLQPLNGIPCVPFSAGQPFDVQLMEAVLPLLKHLSLQKDVRPILHEKFHIPEWFQQQGIPASEVT